MLKSLAFATALSGLALPAAAQTAGNPDDSDLMERTDLHPVTEEFIADQEGRDWFVLAGPVGFYGPDYEGSDDYRALALPFFLVTYKDRFYADPIRGAGAYLFDNDAFQLGAGVNYAFGREEDENDRLTGLGDIDGGAAAEISLEYQPWSTDLPVGPSVTARVQHQFTGSDTGTLAELNAGFGFPLGGRAILRPSLNAQYGDEEYNQSFFGISPLQAANSGLPAYEAGAGFKSVGINLFGTYLLTPDWFLTGVVSYDRLTGDAADSPIVDDENQFRLIAGVVRRF